MAVLTAISGLNGKLPAAFLLDISGVRILMDLGEGPEPGVRPDLTGIGRVDAIFLSHGHIDHVGALDLWQSLGAPPVYATAATFRALPPQGIQLPASACHILPLQGAAVIAGVAVTLGRSGHAIGGVWLHIEAANGLLYMGDWSRESSILAFDPPPKCTTLITDISYCDRDETLAQQVAQLVATAPNGAVLPAPVMGRGCELALRLAEAGRDVAICPVVRSEIEALACDDEGQVTKATKTALHAMLARLKTPQMANVQTLIVAVEADHAESIVPELAANGRKFVLTGHVAPNSLGARLLAAGQAQRLNWNVHPGRICNAWLADETGASRVLPAFGAMQSAPLLAQSLGERLTLTSPLQL